MLSDKRYKIKSLLSESAMQLFLHDFPQSTLNTIRGAIIKPIHYQLQYVSHENI